MKIRGISISQMMHQVSIELLCDDQEQADRLHIWLANSLKAGRVVRLRPAEPGNAPSVETVQ